MTDERLREAAKRTVETYEEWMRRANDPESFLPTHTRVGALQSQQAHDHFMRAMGALRSALAATPEPTLDVEQLAEAMDESFWPDDLPFIDDRAGFWRPFAQKVAARLSQSTPE